MLSRIWNQEQLLGRSGRDVGQPIVVATHPRSGTHLTIDLLRKQFAACKGWVWPWETLHHLYVNLDRIRPQSSHPLSVDEAAALMKRPDRPTLKTHSKPSFSTHPSRARRFVRRLIRQGDVLYVVRDGRDVLCSAFLWEQTHSDLDCSLSTFLRGPADEPSRVKQWVEHVRVWTQRDDVYVVRFEDILQESQSVIERLGHVLDEAPLWTEPLLPRRIESASRWRDYWRRLTGNHESTTIVARPDGTSPPDWKDAFTEADRQFFWEEGSAILRECGYEADASWVEEASTTDAVS